MWGPLAIAIFCLVPLASGAATPSDAPLPPVEFSKEAFPDHFGANCTSITEGTNKFMRYKASTCKAMRGVVMIKATPAVSQAKAWDVFYQTAFSAAGYAVNQDYYGQGAQFVVGNDNAANGCLMLSGERVAHHQRRIKQGKNMGHELGSMMNAAQRVRCPDFLK